MQYPHITNLTAEEYVSTAGWKKAPPPPCCQGLSCQECGAQKHGTYTRKYPHGIKIARWYCQRCQKTFSALPIFLASCYRGTLAELERQVALAETASSLMEAVRILYPNHPHPEHLWRTLKRRVTRVHQCLSALSGLLLVLSLTPPKVVEVREWLSSEAVLCELRKLGQAQLPQLSIPLGFHLPP